MPTHMLINLDNSLYRKIQNIRSQDMTYIYIYILYMPADSNFNEALHVMFLYTYIHVVGSLSRRCFF